VVKLPETRYARSGDVNIAYQVVGDGPQDLVFVQADVSHLEWHWEEPSYARFLHRLASFSRLIMFDKRGVGLSDRVSMAELPTLEQRMDDVGAVMDAVGSRSAAVFGISEGGAMSALFAATYPERVSSLVLFGALGTLRQWLRPDTRNFQHFLDAVERSWGQGLDLPYWAPSRADDPHFKAWYARWARLAASPGAAVALLRMNMEIDVTHVLPAIRIPTLVLHRASDLVVPAEEVRYVADQIPGSKYVELSGSDHLAFAGNGDAIVDESEEFLTGVRPAPEADRVLATVLITDIVGSTQRAAELGDRRWHDLLNSYYGLARKELDRFRGREIKTTGDGFLATFDGPARGIRCACAIASSAEHIGIATRAGLHTGECEIMGADLGGIAVHIGARVAAKAAPREVLVSSTVKDLVAGSGLQFEDRGPHLLKGVPEEWRLFAVERERVPPP
jgi:class 3 adenylate cyclase